MVLALVAKAIDLLFISDATLLVAIMVVWGVQRCLLTTTSSPPTSTPLGGNLPFCVIRDPFPRFSFSRRIWALVRNILSDHDGGSPDQFPLFSDNSWPRIPGASIAWSASIQALLARTRRGVNSASGPFSAVGVKSSALGIFPPAGVNACGASFDSPWSLRTLHAPNNPFVRSSYPAAINWPLFRSRYTH